MALVSEPVRQRNPGWNACSVWLQRLQLLRPHETNDRSLNSLLSMGCFNISQFLRRLPMSPAAQSGVEASSVVTTEIVNFQTSATPSLQAPMPATKPLSVLKETWGLTIHKPADIVNITIVV